MCKLLNFILFILTLQVQTVLVNFTLPQHQTQFYTNYQSSMASNAIKNIIIRKSSERGHADHGWLNTYHTFSFANYYDPKFESWGSLRVINEDRVTGGNGFGTHPHREYEIFSYVISGSLLHKDSMGNKEIIHPGEVQFTSAGTGIYHSEFNASPTDLVHFLQIWVKPNQKNLTPSYTTKKYTEEQRKNRLCPIVTRDGKEDSIQIHSDINVYATFLDEGKEVKFQFEKGRKGYIHLCQTGGSLLLNGEVQLDGGDGAFITDTDELKIEGKSSTPSEFLFFDIAN